MSCLSRENELGTACTSNALCYTPKLEGSQFVRPEVPIVLVVVLYTFQSLLMLENGLMICNASSAWRCRWPRGIPHIHMVRPTTLGTNDDSQPEITRVRWLFKPRMIVPKGRNVMTYPIYRSAGDRCSLWLDKSVRMQDLICGRKFTVKSNANISYLSTITSP